MWGGARASGGEPKMWGGWWWGGQITAALCLNSLRFIKQPAESGPLRRPGRSRRPGQLQPVGRPATELSDKRISSAWR